MTGKRVLWASTGPFKQVAYGLQSAKVCRILKELGHDIVMVAGDTDSWNEFEGMKVVPGGVRNHFLDTIQTHYNDFGRNICITLKDVWSIAYMTEMKDIKWCPWVPVDAPLWDGCDIVEILRHCEQMIAMSHFGKEQIEKYIDTEILYSPHGVDTKIFRPMDNKKELKRKLGVPENSFLFGFVGYNWGMRKNIPRLLEAFSIFLKKNPDADAYLYLYTNMWPQLGSAFDLPLLVKKLGIEKKIIHPDRNIAMWTSTEEKMSEILNAFDVYVTASMGEGFGVPLLESASCGIPSIAPDNTAQTELVEGRGWLVKCSDSTLLIQVPTLQDYAIVDLWDMVEKMTRAYYNGSEREKYGKQSREFAMQYSWDNIKNYWNDIMDKIEVDDVEGIQV